MIRTLFLLLILVAPAAFGQSGPSDGSSLNNIAIDDFADMMQAMKVTGDSYATIFISEGADLAKVFFFITAAWIFFKLIISDKHPLVRGEMLKHCTNGVIVALMLANWAGPATIASLGQFGNISLPVSVKGLFVESFDELQAPIFAKAGMDKGTVVKAIGSTFATFWQASDKRGDIRDAARAKAAGKSVFAWITDSVSLSLQAIGDKVVTFFVSIVVSVAAVGLIVVYLFVIYFGDILVIFGMTLGPLMIPCLLFPKVDYLFDNWLKFMIGSGFYKLIAALTAVLTLGTIKTIQIQVNAMYAKALNDTDSLSNGTLFAGGFLLSTFMTVVYMLFGLFLMRQVHAIAQSLTTGNAGMGTKAVQSADSETAKAGEGKK